MLLRTHILWVVLMPVARSCYAAGQAVVARLDGVAVRAIMQLKTWICIAHDYIKGDREARCPSYCGIMRQIQ